MDTTVASLALNTAQTANAKSALDPLRAHNKQAAQEAAESFEAMFIAQMLQNMNQNVGSDSLFGGGNGDRIYHSMLNEQYAEEIAKRGGIGIADSVLAELVKLQEA